MNIKHAAAVRHPQMKTNNPMRNQESRDKMRKSLQGKKLAVRCGNGSVTEPQRRLAEALAWEMETVIKTAEVRDKVESLPHNYKVDIGNPQLKIAIEVDGNSHRLIKRKLEDKLKTEVLSALGWSVLRFWNEEVMADTEAVVSKVKAFIASK